MKKEEIVVIILLIIIVIPIWMYQHNLEEKEKAQLKIDPIQIEAVITNLSSGGKRRIHLLFIIPILTMILNTKITINALGGYTSIDEIIEKVFMVQLISVLSVIHLILLFQNLTQNILIL